MSRTLDLHEIRRGYPILNRVVGQEGQKLIYLDSAATSLVPDKVLDDVVAYEHTSCANIHRGAHLLAEESTDIYESVREKVAGFIGSPSYDQVIFTHGATESLNMVARCWASPNLKMGDVIAIACDNHHSNIVPWQMVAQEHGFELAYVGLTTEGILDEDSWRAVLARKPRIVVLTHVSSVLGYMQPRLQEMVFDANAIGAKVVLDCAQSVGHLPVSIAYLPVDFLAFSAHKMHGLTGLGVLWCAEGVLPTMKPFYGGGGMIERVDTNGFRSASSPAAFEAGTPAIASVVSLGSAIAYEEAIGLEPIAEHTRMLCRRFMSGISDMQGIRVLGDDDIPREALVSFVVSGMHPHDVSQMLSNRGIAVRAGHHCAMLLHQALGVMASVRASFSLYTTIDDVDALLCALSDIEEEARSYADR